MELLPENIHGGPVEGLLDPGIPILIFFILDSEGLEVGSEFIYAGEKYRVVMFDDKGDYFVIGCWLI